MSSARPCLEIMRMRDTRFLPMVGSCLFVVVKEEVGEGKLRFERPTALAGACSTIAHDGFMTPFDGNDIFSFNGLQKSNA
jgi:hypothetical protein